MKKICNKFGNRVRVDSIPVGECFMTTFDGGVFMMCNKHGYPPGDGKTIAVMNLTSGSVSYFEKDDFVMPVDVEIIVDKRGKDND